MTTDNDVSLSLLVQNDIDAQNAIRDWEAYRARNQAVLRAQVPAGETVATDAGTCGWESRKGSIDYAAAYKALAAEFRHHLGQCLPITDRYEHFISGFIGNVEDFRKAGSESFFVRPELRPAPKPPEPDLTEALQASIAAAGGAS